MIKIKIDKEKIKYLVNENFKIETGKDEYLNGTIKITKEKYDEFNKLQNNNNLDEVSKSIDEVLTFDEEVNFDSIQKINIFTELMNEYMKNKGKSKFPK